MVVTRPDREEEVDSKDANKEQGIVVTMDGWRDPKTASRKMCS